MAGGHRDSPKRRVEALDEQTLASRLRQAARVLRPGDVMDDLEIRHLVHVVTACALLHDVYSDERIAQIMNRDQNLLDRLIDGWIEQYGSEPAGERYLLRRLPDEVRLIGDKALFDLGLLGRRSVKGYDLEQLGARAYRTAGEALQLLADDRRLCEFFKENRLLMLPLEEEVGFLRQCSERFRIYADILKGSRRLPGSGDTLQELAFRVPLMAAAAEALAGPDETDLYLQAARGEVESVLSPSREQLISAYERMLLFSSLEMDRLKDALNRTVVDQPQAVDRLCDEFSLFGAGTRDPRKPPAYFLVGPTGVGKNFLVERLTGLLRGLWGIDIPMLTIEGPNYTYPSDINELRGATRGFIRSDEEGLLTAFHERSSRSPFSVILIDEVEKAHGQLVTFFLSILDRGTTTDSHGNELNFSNCMFFFTSNLGYSDAQRRGSPIGYLDEVAREEVADRDIRRDLRRALRPEFVNRLRLIHFNRLSIDSAERILDLELEKIHRRYREVHGLEIELDPAARAELIRQGFSSRYGARRLAATLESVCNVELAKKIRRDDSGAGGNRESMVSWLREIRSGQRAFDAEEVKRRVLDLARARLDYRRLRIGFRDGRFVYEPVD